MRKAQSTYEEIGLSSEVLSASPHKQILMLFNKTLESMELAKQATLDKDIVKKSAAIKKAIDILTYLQACLNLENEQTKELASQLDRIYEFLKWYMVNANLTNDANKLSESYQMLNNIKEGWEGIEKDVAIQ